MTKLGSTTAVAQWFDPSAGTYTKLGPLPNTGSHTFTPPGNNASGAGDWVLVLQPSLVLSGAWAHRS